MKDEEKRVSDYIPSQQVYNAPKKDITQIMNSDLKVWDFTTLQGQFGDFIVVLCSDVKETEKFVFVTGSKVIIKKLNTLKESNHLPVIAKIVKVKRYYDIV